MPADWNTSAFNSAAMIAAVVLIVLNIKDIVAGIAPLGYALGRWRGGIGLEHNLSSARMRNSILICSAIPLLVITDRLELYNPSWMGRLDLGWTLAARAAVFAGFLLLRHLAVRVLFRDRMDRDVVRAVEMCILNFSIALTWILVILTAAMTVCGVGNIAIGHVARAIICIFYVVVIFYERKILRSCYGSLGTFLYLCALESVSTAILVVSSLIF